MKRKPRPRELTPEEQEEREIQEEIELKMYGYSSMEEKRRHEQEMIDDLQRWEEEDERKKEQENYFRRLSRRHSGLEGVEPASGAGDSDEAYRYADCGEEGDW